jgi:hypothetical protein
MLFFVFGCKGTTFFQIKKITIKKVFSFQIALHIYYTQKFPKKNIDVFFYYVGRINYPQFCTHSMPITTNNTLELGLYQSRFRQELS